MLQVQYIDGVKVTWWSDDSEPTGLVIHDAIVMSRCSLKRSLNLKKFLSYILIGDNVRDNRLSTRQSVSIYSVLFNNAIIKHNYQCYFKAYTVLYCT